MPKISNNEEEAQNEMAQEANGHKLYYKLAVNKLEKRDKITLGLFYYMLND